VNPFILILIWHTTVYGGEMGSISQQQYGSAAGCQQAAAQVRKATEHVVAICVPQDKQ
jgi:hypothetical protein